MDHDLIIFHDRTGAGNLPVIFLSGPSEALFAVISEVLFRALYAITGATNVVSVLYSNH
jgi:hypothetical protein